MSNNKNTILFSRILLNIKDELEEGNPKFTKILNDTLSNDGTLALKSKFGQAPQIHFTPEPKDNK